ncbi:hypothetical protein V6N13_098279 [Hibiscus sabdariffa]
MSCRLVGEFKAVIASVMSTVYGVSGRDRGLVHWSPPLSGWCKPNSDGSRCVDSCRSIREVSLDMSIVIGLWDFRSLLGNRPSAEDHALAFT